MSRLSIVFLFACGAIVPQAFSKDVSTDQILEITKEFYRDFHGAPMISKIVLQKAKGMMWVVDKVNLITRRAHGTCDPNNMIVEINIDWWKSESNIWRKRKLIYHELGHCSLGLSHPKSHFRKTIMNHDINLVTNSVFWDKMVKELKKRHKTYRSIK